MYSYGTIMNPLGVKKVQMCHFVGTAPVIRCCIPKGTFFAGFFFLSFLTMSAFTCTLLMRL